MLAPLRDANPDYDHGMWAELRAHLPHLLPASLILLGLVQGAHRRIKGRRP